MTVAVPVGTDGQITPGWGRAQHIAVATTAEQAVTGWQVYDVGWDTAHDEGTEGSHHARIARFLIDHDVTTVMAEHMGEGMTRMLATMGIPTLLGAHGDARANVEALLASSN